ncbi:MAG: hypothetical protein JOZ96_05770 [Acidobacteria bacterium]|nr:hypothetical protein [Acidobacteriota bacterium]
MHKAAPPALPATTRGQAVPLFNKLGTGRWQLTGRWRVTSAEHRFDEAEQRMLWRFTLKKVGSRQMAVGSSEP